MENKTIKIPSKVKLSKHLNADSLLETVYSGFNKIPDFRSGDTNISLPDALMSGFAMFSLKDPSLLAFDSRRNDNASLQNLKSIYGIKTPPSDTRMREILDDVEPEDLRPSFKNITRKLQRAKALDPYKYIEGHFLVSLDGTGFFSSKHLNSEACLVKKDKKTGEVIGYYQQLLGASIVHPNFKEVIPLMPEMIVQQDGSTKNDCERNAAKRFLTKLRKDYPYLKICILEDSLSANAPHIRLLESLKFRYILGIKPGDHEFLFNYINTAVEKGITTEFECVDKNDPKITHRYRFLNNVPLNKSNQDVLVNFLEYWEITDEGTKHFTWITDFTITPKNVYTIMKGGRSRWKVENETFNTLKNQGYHFEHNFGLGKNNLSQVFALLMMLAFLVDQTQQLRCNLFQAVWRKGGSKRALWEKMRSLFMTYKFESMTHLYRALFYGFEIRAPVILNDTC